MPINESQRATRERWPLKFDLEGVPRDSTTRKLLLEQERLAGMAIEDEMGQVKPVTNTFAASTNVGERVIDINNPPRDRYVHQEYPKMMYHHDSGQTVTVHNIEQFKLALRKGFQRQPAPGRDYSKISRGGIAQIAQVGPPREKEFSPEELNALDEAEQIAAAEAELAQGETGQIAAAEAELADEQNAAGDPYSEPEAGQTLDVDQTESTEERPSGRRRRNS